MVFRGDCHANICTIIEGNIDKSKVLRTWQHPQTKEVFSNVFEIANESKIPTDMKVGENFKFKLSSDPQEYYPCYANVLPHNIDKKLSIELLP